jgi:16S rRNA (cytosine1402-N4)-methyltransferase
MTGGRDSGKPAVAGGLALHIPVLAGQMTALLAPKDGGVYIDATFGAGGHARSILDAAATRVIGLDRDQRAVALGADLVERAAGRLTLVEAKFSQLDRVARELGYDAVDGVVLDLGVSSMQLDQPERGFSFRREGPLDMRMGGSGPTAADVVAQASERDLATIIATLGEERHARAVARAITAARRTAAIQTTTALAAIVSRALPTAPRHIDPATRTFQALRMFVNAELQELEQALSAAERVLRPGGRLIAIAFHSLEDRIVKTFLAERSRSLAAGSRHWPQRPPAAPSFRLLNKRPIVPDPSEIAANPRARSAKLRGAERTAAAALAEVRVGPRLPTLSEVLANR